jgi:hypothetical protein
MLLHAVESCETRNAQTAGLADLDQRGFLLRGIAEPTRRPAFIMVSFIADMIHWDMTVMLRVGQNLLSATWNPA